MEGPETAVFASALASAVPPGAPPNPKALAFAAPGWAAVWVVVIASPEIMEVALASAVALAADDPAVMLSNAESDNTNGADSEANAPDAGIIRNVKSIELAVDLIMEIPLPYCRGNWRSFLGY
jgi:hypothetical protein